MEPGENPPLASVACAACGSTRLGWRVKRSSGARKRASALAWTCRECGAGWEEPLHQPDPAGADAAPSM